MLVTYRLSIAVLSAMPPKPSHRQNQNHTQQINWTYDFKRDV